MIMKVKFEVDVEFLDDVDFKAEADNILWVWLSGLNNECCCSGYNITKFETTEED